MGIKLNTADFIERSKIIHGNRYDYSKSNYVTSTSFVVIVCPIHGQFRQRPKNHMRGDGCNKCGENRAGLKRKGTSADFIERANKLHGNRYDYSLTEYVGAREKLTVICPEHGHWQVQAGSHLAGTGCPTCGGRKQLSTKEFLRRARAKHGDRFDYSKTVYINADTKMLFSCPDHGEFLQTSSGHLKGRGCPKCNKRQRGLSRRGNTDHFVSRANDVHGNRYDYSKSEYVKSDSKVIIICKKHGEFFQTPANHLQGLGCKLCGYENAGQYHKKDTIKFIKAAREAHGDRYDYSKTEYVGAREKLTITCPVHGPFEQIAGVHLRGAGCEACSYEERAEQQRMTFDKFISRGSEVHANFYDYSLAREKFRGGSDRVPIICPEHGVFEQAPVTHCQGRGCPVCRYVKSAEGNRKAPEAFIRNAIAIHGDTYDYSQTEYKGAHDHVTIICLIDGPFTQSPTSHLSGTGCPKCSRRAQGAPRNLVRALRGEFDAPKPSFVYLIRFKLPCTDNNLIKVGSGSGTRMQTVIASIKRVGGTDMEVEKRYFETSGEAIVFEHIAHDQVMETKFPVPAEYKFPGYSEVFCREPNLVAVDNHQTLERFRNGDRWDPRKINDL
ncbi:hypothetical protein [Paramagnetospirillum caucaseum]|uniref:hypothetical protein n=1 Tax=Paramagnetospirillum caucaseum TaxID=1244869 RepID=UPI000349E05B|nr:hypothetical protein [Paramagnetospirillum caucaseum]